MSDQTVTYRARREGRAWVLYLPGGGLRSFARKSDLMDYLKGRERRLVGKRERRIARIVWEANVV